MTIETSLSEPKVAIDVWQEVLSGVEAGYVSVLYYIPPAGHGSNPIKRSVIVPIDNWKDVCDLEKKQDEVFSVGSPIYGEKLLIIPTGTNGDGELDLDYFKKTVLPHITHQPQLPGLKGVLTQANKDSEMFKYADSQLCLLDFDCPSDPVNTQKIVETLKKSRFEDWYLLDSGGGYHLIFDKVGFSVPQLIQVYGELISLFSK